MKTFGSIALAAILASLNLARAADNVLIPGDPEAKMRAERTKNGVPLPDDTWAAIVNTAREVGVSEVSIQRVTA